MSVRIAYHEDTLRDARRRVARVHYDATVSFEQFLREAADGGRMREAELRNAFVIVREALIRRLADGDRVRTPLGVFSLALRRQDRALPHDGTRNVVGGREEELPTVTPGRLRLAFRADRSVMKEIRRLVRLERVTAREVRLPFVRAVRSMEAPDRGSLAPGELAELRGARLAFDSDDAACGVCFRPDGGAGEVRASVYGRTTAATTLFRVPELASGEWRLVVRTRPTGAAVRESVAVSVRVE